MQTIEIKCKGSGLISLNDLTVLQGNLKELSEVNYQKLKGEIIRLGFSSPIHVWTSKDKFNILDGTQRTRTLIKMQEEGYIIPDLPIVEVFAKDVKEAKQKVLAFTSQYGQITDQGLYEFISESDIDYTEIQDNYRFPEIDTSSFIDNFYSAPEPEEPEPEPKPKASRKVCCPNCDFTFFLST